MQPGSPERRIRLRQTLDAPPNQDTPPLMPDKTVQDAVRDSIKLLGPRAHSRAELVAKLRKKGFENDTIDEAILKLESLGLIDDRSFAAGCVESLARRRPEGQRMAKVR
ncbi:MAG: RecX family transcriptional regulator, partial [Chlorobiales bacterium]|nr:RecX family transcriptional regulator [Chlorobiales bacterium]